MSDDERPKKSWREIDAQRDRKSQTSPRRDPDDRSKERAQKSAAYGKYKAQLDKMFTPGGGANLPESLKSKLGPSTDEGKKKQELTQALRDKGDAAALEAFLAADLALPEDPRLLIRLLDLQKETLLEPVLRALLELIEGGQKPSRMLLIQKLDALVLRLGSGSAVDLARQIRAALD
jgi:hypothetical protein